MNAALELKQDKLEYLSQINLLHDLTPEDLRTIERLVPVLSYPPGSMVYEPTGRLNRLYFLKRGRVRLYWVSSDGKELTLAVLKDGSIFGESDNFATGAGACYAETLSDTLVCTMTTRDLVRFMVKRPMVAIKMIEILPRALREAQGFAATLALHDVRTRLLYLLVKLADEFGLGEGSYIRLDLKLTHQDLAHMIGATRESVSGALSDLSRKGIVRTARGRIEIHPIQARQVLEGFS